MLCQIPVNNEKSPQNADFTRGLRGLGTEIALSMKKERN
jgi:hypothetical protein